MRPNRSHLQHPKRAGQRGVSLVEVAIALVVISITVVTMFSVFAANQSSLVNTIRQQQINQVLRNEAERVLSLNYNNITNANLTAVVDNESYAVSIVVTQVQLKPPAAAPVVKQIVVTAVHSPSGDQETVVVVKAP